MPPKFNFMTFVKDWFGLLAIVIAAVSAVGFSVSTPWPARADVESVQREVSDLRKQVKSESCLVLKLLYKTYEDDKKDAEKDLAKNPESDSAQRARDDAIDAMKDIKDQIKLTCKITELQNQQ